MPPIYFGTYPLLKRYIGTRQVSGVMYRGENLLGASTPTNPSDPGLPDIPNTGSLLRQRGGLWLLAEAGSRANSDGSGDIHDGLGTDLVGFTRDVAQDSLYGPNLVGPSNEWVQTTGTGMIVGEDGSIEFPNSASLQAATQTNKLRQGCRYETKFKVESYTGTGSGWRINLGAASPVQLGAASTPGVTYSYIFAMNGVNIVAQLAQVAKGKVSEISVREVYAAVQTSNAARPLLRKTPVLGPEMMPENPDWTLAAATIERSGNEFTVTGTGGASVSSASTSLAVKNGATYYVRLEIWRETWTGSTYLSFPNSPGVGSLLNNTAFPTIRYAYVKSESELLTLAATMGNASANNGLKIKIRNVSVREVTDYEERFHWQFDGANRMFYVPPVGARSGGGAFLAISVAPARLPPEGTAYTLIEAVGANANVLRLKLLDNGKFTFFRSDTNSNITLTSTTIAERGKTYTLAGYLRPSGQIYFMINGAVEDEGVWSGNGTADLVQLTLCATSGPSEHFFGNVQSAMMAATVQTLEEAKSLEGQARKAAGTLMPVYGGPKPSPAPQETKLTVPGLTTWERYGGLVETPDDSTVQVTDPQAGVYFNIDHTKRHRIKFYGDSVGQGATMRIQSGLGDAPTIGEFISTEQTVEFISESGMIFITGDSWGRVYNVSIELWEIP